MIKEIKTPWGVVIPQVSLFPIFYLMFIYGLVYVLPYGRDLIGMSWFDWLRSEDGPLEWMQFLEYAVSSFLALLIYIKTKRKKNFNSIFWFLIALLSLLVAGEEISWGERIIGIGNNFISEINVQGETKFHNLPFFHNYLLDPIFEISCIFLGWIGWRRFKNIKALS